MATKEAPKQNNVAVKDWPYRKRHRGWWLVSRPFDLVSSLLYMGVLVPYVYSFITQSGYDTPLVGWQVALMVATILALLVVDRVEYFFYGEVTPFRAGIGFLITRIVLIEIVTLLDRFQYSPFLYLIAPFLACLYFNELVSYGLAVLAWITYFVKHMYYSPGWLSNGTELHYLVLFTVALTLVITIAHVVVREQATRVRAEELLADLEISHQQLKAYAEQVAELATTRERNRLARDIHDSLGHYLTVINVQLEKALALREKKPRETEQAIIDAKYLAREALQDVRASVGALRTNHETPMLIQSLTELIERVQSENCAVEIHLEGNEDTFSQQGSLALYRVVQEGLTNVQRHANATHIWINLRFGEQETTLVLCDNGQGFDTEKWRHGAAGSERGYGLRGLEERLEMVGGNLKIESVVGQGTTLHVTMPQNRYTATGDEAR